MTISKPSPILLQSKPPRENAAPLAAETPSGTRQILLYGKIEMGDYPIKAIFSDGYPQIFDVTGLGMNAGNSDPQPFCIDSYDLKGYTASGSLAYQTVFTTSYGYIATFWARTYTHVFTVPDNVTRLQVIRQATEEVKLDKQMQSSAVATLISPQPGDTLGQQRHPEVETPNRRTCSKRSISRTTAAPTGSR